MRLLTSSLCASLALLVGCDKPTPAETKPRPVVSEIVGDKITNNQRSFSGMIKSGNSANLAFEVSGRIAYLNVALGDTPALGDTLASVDKTDYQTRVADAQSSLDQAQSELVRTQKLFETGNASQSQLDAAIRSEKSARAAFSLAERQLQNTDLIMPFDGIVSAVELESQELASTGQTVLTVQKKGVFEFQFGVPTDLIQSVKAGQEIEVLAENVSTNPFKARILRVSPSSNSDTTFTVEATFLETSDAMRDGMVGEAIVTLTDKIAAPYYALPIASVIGGGMSASPSVWLLEPQEDGTAVVKKSEIATGFLLEDGHIAVTEGVNPGDILVTRGVDEIQDGMVVRYIK